MRTMLRILAAVVLVIGIGANVGVADEEHATAAGGEQTVQGELLDTQCYTAGQAKGEQHAECAQKCLASGIPAGLLREDGTVLILTTNPQPLAEHAGKQIRATGQINNELRTMSPDKLEVRGDDGQWSEVAMKDAHREG